LLLLVSLPPLLLLVSLPPFLLEELRLSDSLSDSSRAERLDEEEDLLEGVDRGMMVGCLDTCCTCITYKPLSRWINSINFFDGV